MSRVIEIKHQIEVYEKQMQGIQEAINALKIELADLVLQGEDPTSIIPGPIEVVNAEKVTIVSVKFKDNGKTYDYLWHSDKEVKIGDKVQVDCRWGGLQEVEVVNVCTIDNTSNTTAWANAYPVDEDIPF